MERHHGMTMSAGDVSHADAQAASVDTPAAAEQPGGVARWQFDLFVLAFRDIAAGLGAAAPALGFRLWDLPIVHVRRSARDCFVPRPRGAAVVPVRAGVAVTLEASPERLRLDAAGAPLAVLLYDEGGIDAGIHSRTGGDGGTHSRSGGEAAGAPRYIATGAMDLAGLVARAMGECITVSGRAEADASLALRDARGAVVALVDLHVALGLLPAPAAGGDGGRHIRMGGGGAHSEGAGGGALSGIEIRGAAPAIASGGDGGMHSRTVAAAVFTPPPLEYTSTGPRYRGGGGPYTAAGAGAGARVSAAVDGEFDARLTPLVASLLNPVVAFGGRDAGVTTRGEAGGRQSVGGVGGSGGGGGGGGGRGVAGPGDVLAAARGILAQLTALLAPVGPWPNATRRGPPGEADERDDAALALAEALCAELLRARARRRRGARDAAGAAVAAANGECITASSTGPGRGRSPGGGAPPAQLPAPSEGDGGMHNRIGSGDPEVPSGPSSLAASSDDGARGDGAAVRGSSCGDGGIRDRVLAGAAGGGSGGVPAALPMVSLRVLLSRASEGAAPVPERRAAAAATGPRRSVTASSSARAPTRSARDSFSEMYFREERPTHSRGRGAAATRRGGGGGPEETHGGLEELERLWCGDHVTGAASPVEVPDPVAHAAE